LCDIRTAAGFAGGLQRNLDVLDARGLDEGLVERFPELLKDAI